LGASPFFFADGDGGGNDTGEGSGGTIVVAAKANASFTVVKDGVASAEAQPHT
jgi:hypothetical protein